MNTYRDQRVLCIQKFCDTEGRVGPLAHEFKIICRCPISCVGNILLATSEAKMHIGRKNGPEARVAVRARVNVRINAARTPHSLNWQEFRRSLVIDHPSDHCTMHDIDNYLARYIGSVNLKSCLFSDSHPPQAPKSFVPSPLPK